MSAPDISIVIPVYNRGELIRYTLESVRRASTGLEVEVIVVDDGSNPPAAPTITALGYAPTTVIRQPNQGLLFARLTGLAAVRGRHTLFLDSDDLISPDKLRAQVGAMDAARADVSYTDTARVTIEGDYDALVITPDEPCTALTDPAGFFIRVQPPPHSPVFETGYLKRIVAEAFFPPSSLYNSVAEIWFYHNAATRPARVIKVPGPHTIIGRHPGARLTNHWEKLGIASLAVMEAFAVSCPVIPETASARQLVAEKAFQSWRRLPRGFSPEFQRRLLAVWRHLALSIRPQELGGGFFQRLAGIVGPINAARLLRQVQNGSYASCRTVDDETLAKLLAALPPAGSFATP